jgi:beta-carotene ketolase (CrtO type)
MGADVNSLTCAAYLAKGGLKVKIFEKRNIIGGGVTTEEVTKPGFLHNLASLVHIFIPEKIWKEDLELERYGLKYLQLEPLFIYPFVNGPLFTFYKGVEKTVESISQYSKKDAESYRRLAELLNFYLANNPVKQMEPPPSPSTIAAFWEKTEQGREIMRYELMSTAHFLDEWFENDMVKAAFCAICAVEGTPPFQSGGARSMLAVPMWHRIGFNIAKGGSGSLSNALRRYIEAHGGSIVTNAKVKKVVVKNNKAIGLKLEDGSEHTSDKAIVSTDPKQLFLELLDPDIAGEKMVKKLRQFLGCEFVTMAFHLALHEAPVFIGSDKSVVISIIGEPSPLKVSAFFEELRQNQLPKAPSIFSVCPTVLDPSQAPPGKHSFTLNSRVPFDMGWTHESKEKRAKEVIGYLRKFAPNMTDDNIISMYIESPVDIYDRCGLWGGSGFDHLMHQMGWFRPNPELSHYKTPIRGLHITGPGTHPGGSVRLSNGYNTAQQVLKDFGMKK